MYGLRGWGVMGLRVYGFMEDMVSTSCRVESNPLFQRTAVTFF